jgi:segregation and condensation protein A
MDGYVGVDDTAAAASAGGARSLLVDVDGYAGPLDVLLDLARAQKVDLKEISILQLADQYLGFVAAARRADLNLAAEYLVMAAWLAYLKSRLLLPKPSAADEPSAEEMAETLTRHLRHLEEIRKAAAALSARPRCGIAFAPRGQHAGTETVSKNLDVIHPHLNDLLRAYLDIQQRRLRSRPLSIRPSDLWSVDDAIERIRSLLGHWPGWESLERYLPPEALNDVSAGSFDARSRVAAVFAASLELARQGALRLRQSGPFGPIYVKPQRGEEISHDG